MGENIKQFYNPDDDCVYFYDRKKKCYRKICDIGAFNELPYCIRQQIKAVKEEAAGILSLPDAE
jgi:hypothetical protein